MLSQKAVTACILLKDHDLHCVVSDSCLDVLHFVPSLSGENLFEVGNNGLTAK